MPESPLQLERLRRLYGTQRAARTLLDYAARQTSTAIGAKMTVDSLHGILNCEENAAVSRRALIGTLRAFAQAGCGRFFAGRHGQPSRFVWAVPLATVGAAVVGDTSVSSSPKTTRTPAIRGGGPGLFSHPFRLRPDLIVSMNLPNDLTGQEADRLARFVQTLPFS
ncbi:MAG TPA: hypothetical protein VNU68_07460 [Verrucomicrobiae bacterium]|jgi:hypothetical protein|nr:hypothetical protein [Verrucomicrobiae bacterium]